MSDRDDFILKALMDNAQATKAAEELEKALASVGGRGAQSIKMLNEEYDELVKNQQVAAIATGAMEVGMAGVGIAVTAVTAGLAALTAGISIALSAAQELTDQFVVWTKMAAEAETQQFKLNNAINNAEKPIGFTKAQLIDLSVEIQNFGVVSAGAVQVAVGGFIRLGLTGSSLEKATKASADMAASLGKDLPEAAGLLTAALANPERGLRGMQAAQLGLSAEQAKLAREMSKGGDIAGAQGLIIDAVAAKYRNAGAEAAATAEGGWTQFHNIMNSVGESLGTIFLPAVEAVQPLLRELAIVLSNIAKGFEGFGEVLGDKVVALMPKLKESLLSVTSSLAVWFDTLVGSVDKAELTILKFQQTLKDTALVAAKLLDYLPGTQGVSDRQATLNRLAPEAIAAKASGDPAAIEAVRLKVEAAKKLSDDGSNYAAAKFFLGDNTKRIQDLQDKITRESPSTSYQERLDAKRKEQEALFNLPGQKLGIRGIEGLGVDAIKGLGSFLLGPGGREAASKVSIPGIEDIFGTGKGKGKGGLVESFMDSFKEIGELGAKALLGTIPEEEKKKKDAPRFVSSIEDAQSTFRRIQIAAASEPEKDKIAKKQLTVSEEMKKAIDEAGKLQAQAHTLFEKYLPNLGVAKAQ